MAYGARRLLMVLALVIADAAASCGGGAVTGDSAGPPGSSLLPAPLSVLRATSAVVEGRVALGDDYLVSPGLFANVSKLAATHQAHFTPDYDPAANPQFTGLGYATYRFHIPGYTGGSEVHYVWDQPLVNWSYGWVGVGNLALNRWDWHAASPAGFFDLGTMAPYISAPGDELVAIVLLMGTTPADFNRLSLGGNAPPVAGLTADVTSGLAPLTVHFDGSSSTDEDPIAKFEWDPQGDGTFTATGTADTFIYTYTSGGVFNAALRVTDIFGLTDTTSLPITVTGEPSGTWHATTVDSSGVDTGLFPSLADVDGRPAVAYYNNATDTSNYGIRYARAADVHGTAWNTPVAIGLSGIWGRHPSLAVVNGNPAVAYADSATGKLKYRRASDAVGTAWNAAVTVNSSLGATPRLVSLAMVNGNPAIAYSDSLADLYFIRATNADGTSWPATPVTVESTGTGAGDFGFLLIAGGNPAVAYIDLDTLDVKFVRAGNASGGSWGAPVFVTSMTGIGTTFSAAIVGGNPAVALVNAVNNRLEYTRAADANGAVWPAPVSILSNLSSARRDPSLAVIAGKPSVSYYDADNGQMLYLRATDANGTAWGTPVPVDSPPGEVSGWYSSLAQVGGNPAVAYYNSTFGELHFAMQYP